MKKILLLFFIIFLNSFSLKIDGNYVLGMNKEKIPLKKYNRIVVYNFGAIEILYKIGAGEKIVAIANHRKPIWPKEKTDKIPLVGHISKPSIERILSYNPDLVIFNVMGNETKRMEELNIPSITFVNRNLDDILNNILVLGELTGCKKNSEMLVKNLKSKMKKFDHNKKIDGKALILYSTSPPTSFGKNSLPIEILKKLGFDVIVPELGAKPIISSEYILKENPRFIIGTRGVKSKEELLSAVPVIKNTKAYKENKIYIIDTSEILRASHRTFDEIEKIYKELKLDRLN